MPEMDGTEAFHRIRETVGGKSCASPVICLTADAVVGAKERYLSEGFTDYLTKPVDSFALERMLLKHLPKNKVEMIREENEAEEVSNEQEQVKSDFNLLQSSGIDPKIGLSYCQNDEEFYHSLLSDFASSLEEKADQLKNCLETEDWHNYTVYVHSLKSSAKMIGAMELSDQAAKLEVAAGSADGDTIRTGHDPMMRKYEAVVRAIRSICQGETSSDGDDEILEFWPE